MMIYFENKINRIILSPSNSQGLHIFLFWVKLFFFKKKTKPKLVE